MTNINILPHHYITNEIDSTIKSCLNCDDPHLHFTAKPCEDTFKQTKYLIFSAIIDFLPAELDQFRCHNCGFSAFYRNGFTPTHFIKMPAVNSNYQTVISARSARIRCRNCNSTCSAKTSLISSGCQISNLLKAKIATRLRSDVSAKTIAFEEGVSPSSVNSTLDSTRCEFRNNFNFLTLHLCFDEFRGTNKNYHFICLDDDNHVIQTILPNRFKKTISDYFMRFPASVRGLVRTVCCDLNSYYVDIVKELFPNAKIIIDRFHLVQMLNRAVNSMRTDMMNQFEHNSKDYKLFKRYWKLFLKRYDALECTHQFYDRTQKSWFTAEQIVNHGLELADTDFHRDYWDYQCLLEAINNPSAAKLKIFKQRILDTKDKCADSSYKVTKADKVLLTFFNYLEPVLTALDPRYCHYTNGPLEGINRKIKQIQRTAYGYRNFEHFKARIYLQTYLGKDTRSSMKIA